MRRRPAAVLSGFGDSPLESLLGEAVALFHRLHLMAEEVYQQGELSVGRRGVLRSLDRFEPQSVPQMARARPVSRQYIQTLVNKLVVDGYVELAENPAHKRSPLVRLTSKGKQFVQETYRRETKLFSDLPISVGKQELQVAASVLQRVREFFESHEWKERLQSMSEASPASSPSDVHKFD